MSVADNQRQAALAVHVMRRQRVRLQMQVCTDVFDSENVINLNSETL